LSLRKLEIAIRPADNRTQVGGSGVGIEGFESDNTSESTFGCRKLPFDATNVAEIDDDPVNVVPSTRFNAVAPKLAVKTACRNSSAALNTVFV
jgi:hypothetical protein